MIDEAGQECRTMSVKRAAGQLGVGINQAYAAVRAGEIPALRVGNSWRVLAEPLNRMLSGADLAAPKNKEMAGD